MSAVRRQRRVELHTALGAALGPQGPLRLDGLRVGTGQLECQPLGPAPELAGCDRAAVGKDA